MSKSISVLFAIVLLLVSFLSYQVGHSRGWQDGMALSRAKRGKVIVYNGSSIFIGPRKCGIFYMANFDVAELPYGPFNIDFEDETWWSQDPVELGVEEPSDD